MTRVVRLFVALLLLHHIDNVCRPAAPRDSVADAVTGAIVRILSGFAEHAAHRVALVGFLGAPDTPEGVTAPRRAVRPARSVRPPRSVRQPVRAIEAAPVVPVTVIEQVHQYDEKR